MTETRHPKHESPSYLVPIIVLAIILAIFVLPVSWVQTLVVSILLLIATSVLVAAVWAMFERRH